MRLSPHTLAPTPSLQALIAITHTASPIASHRANLAKQLPIIPSRSLSPSSFLLDTRFCFQHFSSINPSSLSSRTPKQAAGAGEKVLDGMIMRMRAGSTTRAASTVEANKSSRQVGQHEWSVEFAHANDRP